MRYQGRITKWNDERGFGFITPICEGQQVFVHIKSFLHRQRRPTENAMVTYEIGMDANERVRAERVMLAGERLPWNVAFLRAYVSLMFAVTFLAVLTWGAFSGKLPIPILVLYSVATVATFVAYSLDKLAAREGRWRTQESSLHFLGLIGGWPGALAAQHLFRHKSKKLSFQVVFWFTVALNCGALGWLFSHSALKFIFDFAVPL